MVLSFEQVSFHYPNSRKPVLDDFSWRLLPGRTVLLGPNGAGKSTLISLAATALEPAQGRIRLGPLDTTRRADRSEYRRSVGWVPQQVRAVAGLTAREQVAYAAWLKGMSKSESWAAAVNALDRVGLGHMLGRKTSVLSGGQLRRIGLAQALVHDAKVLLLDEPTAGLDPAQRARFREVLAALPPEHIILVSTHQVDDLSELFNVVTVIDDGIIRFENSVSAFVALAEDGTERQAESAYKRVVSTEA